VRVEWSNFRVARWQHSHHHHGTIANLFVVQGYTFFSNHNNYTWDEFFTLESSIADLSAMVKMILQLIFIMPIYCAHHGIYVVTIHQNGGSLQ
jgi:hypothetical protein